MGVKRKGSRGGENRNGTGLKGLDRNRIGMKDEDRDKIELG